MKKLSPILFLAFLLIIASCNQYKNNYQLNEKSIYSESGNLHLLDSLLNDLYKEDKINGTVLVLKNNHPIFEKSYGFATADKSKQLTKEYQFIIGSIYKEFPAVAIMQLEEKKLLQLQNPISQYISDLPVWSNSITIQHLLQYTSGLPTINWNQLFQNNGNPTEKDVYEYIQKIDHLEFQPGTDYLYTNCSPLLLIKIVEKITNKKFDKYLNDSILKPNYINGITLKDQFPYKNPSLMAMPFNYEYVPDSFKLSVKNLLFVSKAKSLGDWFYKLDRYKIISEKSYKVLAKKFKAEDDFQAPLGNVIYDTKGNLIEHTHHGSSGNYECLGRHFIQDELTIIILTNQKKRNLYELSNLIKEVLK